MSRQSWISFLGLYTWDNTLFENLALPEGFTADDKTILINNLLMETAELEVIYPDPDFMKSAIEAWSGKEVINWERLYKLMLMEYNPIENYNRVEDSDNQNRGSTTHGGKDIAQGSASDTVTNHITSFDSNDLQTHDRSQDISGTTDEVRYGHVISDTTGNHLHSTISGNIGVTTSQQMAEQELDITPKLNIFDIIIKSFISRFCLLVY